jgi:hypothetical protein
MVKPEVIRKVQVFRTYLAAFQEYTTPTLNVDYPVRGGVHGAGSRLSTLHRWLMPDVMLCLDRSESVAIFVMIVSTRETFAATLEGLDAWLRAHEQQSVQQEIDESLHVLTRAASRLSSNADKSTAHKAINTVRRTLSQPEAAA